MTSYADALKIIRELALDLTLALGDEEIPLSEACGRVLAKEISSSENIPSADNSAMDGFAVCAQETRSASVAQPIRLRVQAILAAGDFFGPQMHPHGSCLEIMTGALLPLGKYDAVVKVEDVCRLEDDIVLTAPVVKGSNIRALGTDFSVGQKVLSQNTVLRDQHLMAFAALGIASVPVRKKLRVALLSTGNEIVPWEQAEIKTSQVRNSSALYLKVFLERHHCQVELIGIFGDDKKGFSRKISELLERKFDLILTTGAVSMGKWDFIASALSDLKMKTLFHKVAIRPGKPLLLAVSENQTTVFFGLPGNPISTAVGTQFFVKPLIEAAFGISGPERWAALTEDVTKPSGLEAFFKAQLDQGPKPMVTVLSGQASYMIHSFVQSNAWVQLPASESVIKAGTAVRVFEI